MFCENYKKKLRKTYKRCNFMYSNKKNHCNSLTNMIKTPR